MENDNPIPVGKYRSNNRHDFEKYECPSCGGLIDLLSGELGVMVEGIWYHPEHRPDETSHLV